MAETTETHCWCRVPSRQDQETLSDSSDVFTDKYLHVLSIRSQVSLQEGEISIFSAQAASASSAGAARRARAKRIKQPLIIAMLKQFIKS